MAGLRHLIQYQAYKVALLCTLLFFWRWIFHTPAALMVFLGCIEPASGVCLMANCVFMTTFL